MAIRIFTPGISDGARELSEALRSLDIDVCRSNVNGNDIPRRRRIALNVNWGCGDPEAVSRAVIGGRILNLRTGTATNKLEAFRAMISQNIPIPEFTTNRARATLWVQQGSRVYCRTMLRGHSGEDIVMADQDNPPVHAALYTREVVKRHEFRFHVMDGVVIDGVRKAFRSDVPIAERDRTIMNHAAGSVFIRSGNSLTRAHSDQDLQTMCINAVSAVGLDFGAVDVMSDGEGNYYVLEVNTAPGLEATTLERYADGLTAMHNSEQPVSWSTLPLNPNSNNLTETNTMQALTQEILSTQEARDFLIGESVIVGHRFSGVSLEIGREYPVRDVGTSTAGSVMIQVRKDNGNLQRYTVRGQFQVSNVVFDALTSLLSTTPPAVPTPPSLPPVNSERNLSTTSPLRCIELSDDSMVNVGGQVTFIGESTLITNGQNYTVADIRYGENTGDIFIGIEVEGRGIRRWQSIGFSTGQRTAVNDISGAETPALVVSPVTDMAGVNLTIGDQVRISTRNGGHGLQVGEIKTITNINIQTNTLTLEGIHRQVGARRVTKVTVAHIERERSLVSELNAVTSLIINDVSYRIRIHDLPRVQSFVSTLTV